MTIKADSYFFIIFIPYALTTEAPAEKVFYRHLEIITGKIPNKKISLILRDFNVK